jgi:hypothetical protein
MLYSNRRFPILFISLIIILPFLLFWRWVFKGEVLFWGTLLFQFWPWHHLAKTISIAGEWPLWNPLLGNGTPLLANLQTAFFYPPNLLYLFLPVEHGLTLSIMLHLILAGLFMYFYTRHVGLSPFAATLSALTYMFSGYLVGRTQFVTMINAAAWIPLLLLLGDRVATQRAISNILWLGLALAVQLLAGHAQLWFYSLWLIGAYIIFRSWQEAQSNDRQAGKKWLWLATVQGGWRFGLAVGLAILLVAVQLLPTAELMTQSPRQSGAERTFALTYSFWPWRLVTLLAPDFFGNPAQNNYWGYANYWEDHAYMGVLPFLLALIAIWHYYRSTLRRRTLPRSLTFHRLVPFFATLIPLSLIFAMGWNTPVYLWVFDNVPGFAYFQAPARLLIWYTIAMAILAGVGAHTFDPTAQGRRGWQRLLIAGLGITVAGIAGRLFLSGRSLTFSTAALILGILLTISIIILLFQPSKKATRENNLQTKPSANSVTRTIRLRQIFNKKLLWQEAILLFIAFDLLWFACPLIHTLPATIYSQPIASADFLSAQAGGKRFFVGDQFDYATKFNEYFRFDTFGPLQIDDWQGLKETLVPNLGIYASLPAANNDDPLVVGRWQQLVNLLKRAGSSQRARLLSLMNVGYFIDASPQNAWSVIYSDGAIAIQRVPGVLPRAYFVTQACPVKTEAEVIAKLTSPHFDPHREVIIMDTENFLTFENLSHQLTGQVWVTVSEQGPNQVALSVDAPASGFVVLTDTLYPGWQAIIDGQPAQIWPANLAFRAVAVGTGKHEIVFSYRPRSFIMGLWISIATLVIMIVIAGSKGKCL